MWTALISWRIWRVESESRALAKANTDGPDLHINDGIPVGRVINVIVESGKIHTFPFFGELSWLYSGCILCLSIGGHRD